MSDQIEAGIVKAYQRLEAKGLLTDIQFIVRSDTYDPVTGDVTQGSTTYNLRGVVWDDTREFNSGDITHGVDSKCVIVSETALAFTPGKNSHARLIDNLGNEYDVLTTTRYWDGNAEAWEFGLRGGCGI